VACWVIKTTRPPAGLVPGWRPGTTQELTRCLRPSYRLELMAAGQPCLLWVSGRDRPGVHAVGTLAGPPDRDDSVPVHLTLLADPVDRAELLADPVCRGAEVLRMPAGSNPSWLSRPQFDAVLDRLSEDGADGLGAWLP